jgi:hypothetical protein
VWEGMRTIAFVTTDKMRGNLVAPDGYFIDVMSDLLVTASSRDWQADDPMALPVAIMEYKAAGSEETKTRDL